MPLTTFRYAVTYEIGSQAPKTHRGEVSAGGPATAASRAIKASGKALKGARWHSMSILLEKTATTPEPESEP